MALTLSSARPAPAKSTTPVLPASPGFRRALPWLLSSLGMTVVSLIGQVPGWALLIFGGCTIWRHVVERRGRALPSMLFRILMFLPLAFLVVQTYGTHLSAAGLLTFLIALLSLKILELRTPRDFTVAALLGYFMILSAFFYSQSFALFLYLGLAMLGNTVALILCHGGGRRGAWPAVKLAVGMSIQALPLVALFFVVFPRLPGAIFQRFGGGGTGRTGMSEHLRPGTFSALVQSGDRAFRVTVLSGPQLSQGQLYWRGMTLDLCDQPMAWSFEPPPPLPPRAESKPFSGRVEQQITLFPQGERWLFALDRPAAVQPSASFSARMYSTDTLRSDRPIHNTVIYNVTSELRPAAPPGLSDYRRAFYTRLPEGISSRALDLAKSWRPNGASDDDVIRAASQFFRTGGFSYTLSPGLLPPKTALDTFLFKTRQGFCEHYAAAFSTLMRAAGIPARVVVGYQGGEYNRLGGYYRILQSDAHAWSEVWIEGRGWQREDPTGLVAPERVSYGAENYAAFAGDGSLSDQMRLDRFNALNAPGSLRWLTHNVLMAWDSMDEQWNLLVLAYDQDSQLTIYQKLGVSSLDWLGGTTLTLAVAFSLLGLGTVLMRVLDRGKSAPDDPVRRLYDRFCRRLASRAGLQRAESEGPLDFARRAGAALPEQAAQIRQITELYVASRYAPSTATDANVVVKAFRAAVSQFQPPHART